jgi:formate dehydrogenase subunit delta
LDVEHLVAMANDIANFFDAESGKDKAPESVRFHMSRYWESRMRKAIIEHVRDKGGAGLSDTARAAVEKLASPA